MKHLAMICCNHRWRLLSYDPEAPPVNVVTDGCGTGIAGIVSQGHDWKTADVAVFYSAQQNYPIHEIEMLAGIETMLCHRDILQGVKFRWYTDHKGLIHLLKQKNLSGRQARWMEKISEFDFEVIYVPGSENILSDALLRLYSYDGPGTVHARSEYTYYDIIDNDGLELHSVSMPLLVGLEAVNISLGDFMGMGDLDGASDPGPSVPQNCCMAIEPARSGRPETSREFAACVSRGFALRGPQQCEKSKSAITSSTTDSQQDGRLTICISARGNCAQPASIVNPGPPALEQTLDAELAERADALQAMLEPLPAVTLEELIAGGREQIDLLDVI